MFLEKIIILIIVKNKRIRESFINNLIIRYIDWHFFMQLFLTIAKRKNLP